MTEYFARLLTDRDGNPANQGGPPGTAYQANCDFVRDILPMFGASRIEQETALAEMYFNGGTTVLWDRFDNACALKMIDGSDAAQRRGRLHQAIIDGRWADGIAEIP